MLREIPIMRLIWLGVAKTTVLWRVNSGKAWVSGGGKPERLANGSMVVPFGRPIAIGLGDPEGNSVNGASDLLGYTKITITAEMVGHVIPVITVIEAKADDGGRGTKDQKKFISIIIKAGGIAGVASSVQQAQDIIKKWLNNFSERL